MLFNRKASGFTLIELVIGIVVLSLSFSLVFTMILPTATQSAVQIHQVRAAELGQAMMNEIMGKAFDEHSDMMGGMNRCGEGKDTDLDGAIDTCTANKDLGPDAGETNRSLYNDVDDYNNYSTIEDSLNDNSDDDLDTLYRGFTVNVLVCNDDTYNRNCKTDHKTSSTSGINVAKLIQVTVTSAEGEAITFASYKANF